MFAEVSKTWTGGPSSLTNPENMTVITLSKKELIEFGGADKEKLNVEIEYNVEDLAYAANLSVTAVFDKSVVVFQTDLKSVQGTGKIALRFPFLPKYDNQKKIGAHRLEIILKLRPRYTPWRMIDNIKDYLNLRTVATSVAMRTVILTE